MNAVEGTRVLPPRKAKVAVDYTIPLQIKAIYVNLNQVPEFDHNQVQESDNNPVQESEHTPVQESEAQESDHNQAVEYPEPQIATQTDSEDEEVLKDAAIERTQSSKVKRAKLVQELHELLGHPNDNVLQKMIQNGFVLNSHVTSKDVYEYRI